MAAASAGGAAGTLGSAAAAVSNGVVLVEFRHEVAFVEITEAVHTQIIGARAARLPDLRLRGLLYQLRDDARLRAFVDHELGPLLAHDAAHGSQLVGDLAAYLNTGGNKAKAAARAHLARPTFYQRLRLIETILGVTLDSPESRTSLHVALLALNPDRVGSG